MDYKNVNITLLSSHTSVLEGKAVKVSVNYNTGSSLLPLVNDLSSRIMLLSTNRTGECKIQELEFPSSNLSDYDIILSGPVSLEIEKDGNLLLSLGHLFRSGEKVTPQQMNEDIPYKLLVKEITYIFSDSIVYSGESS